MRHPHLLACFFALASAGVSAATIPDETLARFANGGSVAVIVEYASPAADTQQQKRDPGRRETAESLRSRANRYSNLKNATQRELPTSRTRRLLDYSHLPLELRRFERVDELQRWADDPRIKAIYPDRELYPVLSSSLPLVQQAATAAGGYTGSGTTVAVIDTGINMAHSAFGSCTAIGTPATCRVVANQLAGTATGSTDNSHGTNVSAIVLGMAPDTRIAMLNPFSGSSASSSNLIAAINWAISNVNVYNIAAINMSLGDSGNYTSACNSGNPFLTPITNAINAGIVVVAASGNNGYTGGISAPACTPGALSVGAVYSRNFGSLSWGGSTPCTDNTTAADKPTCFSNSASYLSLLAPGAIITAAGIQQGGTSQASPHVAGAVAVLAAAFPDENITALKNRLISSGTNITDPRNGLIKPRLNLVAAARPANDAYVARTLLAGSTGTASGTNRLATAESGEVLISSNAGGHTVWWRWVAPASGQVSLDTHGSNFDTQLAAYRNATTLATLGLIAANNDDGTINGNSGLLFQALAGNEYVFAVDGNSTAIGSIALNWSLNSSANANLSTRFDNSSPGNYSITVSNAGPQNATNVKLSISLPTGATLANVPAGCVQNGNTLDCNLGNLAATGSITLNLTLNVSEGSLMASVSSDLTDNSPADNGASFIISHSSGEADIPTLPEWAALLLGLVLCLQLRQQSLRDSA